eukprot:c42890_g1_i1 orf=61-240(-)
MLYVIFSNLLSCNTSSQSLLYVLPRTLLNGDNQQKWHPLEFTLALTAANDIWVSLKFWK